jgi:hypothetical protein
MTTMQATAIDPTPLDQGAGAIRLRPARYEPEPGGERPASRRPPAPPVRPPATPAEVADAQRRIAPVLRLALEVLDGRRPPAHLGEHAAPPVLRYWRAACGQRRVRSPARLQRMRVCLPAPAVAEVAAVCTIDGRVRALAARFERGRHLRWSCTAVRLG